MEITRALIYDLSQRISQVSLRKHLILEAHFVVSQDLTIHITLSRYLNSPWHLKMRDVILSKQREDETNIKTLCTDFFGFVVSFIIFKQQTNQFFRIRSWRVIRCLLTYVLLRIQCLIVVWMYETVDCVINMFPILICKLWVKFKNYIQVQNIYFSITI